MKQAKTFSHEWYEDFPQEMCEIWVLQLLSTKQICNQHCTPNFSLQNKQQIKTMNYLEWAN